MAISAAVAALCACGTARAAGPCWQGYAYAGVDAAPTQGIAATITTFAHPVVHSGHVAAWVGVSAPSAWLQVGIAAFRRGEPRRYFEVRLPGRRPQFFDLGPTSLGRHYRMGVVELAGRPGWWKATVNGRYVTRAIFLPESHGRSTPVATGESWSARAGTCNSYAFSFESLRVLGSAGWIGLRARAVADPGYDVTPLAAGFYASSENG